MWMGFLEVLTCIFLGVYIFYNIAVWNDVADDIKVSQTSSGLIILLTLKDIKPTIIAGTIGNIFLYGILFFISLHARSVFVFRIAAVIFIYSIIRAIYLYYKADKLLRWYKCLHKLNFMIMWIF